MFDVTTSITYVTDSGYIYMVLPLFWIGVALISVVNVKLLKAREKGKNNRRHDKFISTINLSSIKPRQKLMQTHSKKIEGY